MVATDDRLDLRIHMAKLPRLKPMTLAMERKLIMAHRAGDPTAGQRLVTANLRFVALVAWRHKNYGFRLDDLMQEGSVGAIKALKKFDPDRGLKFISYATHWITAYIRKFIIENFRLVRYGKTHAERRLFFSLRKAQLAFEREYGQLDSDAMTALIADRFRVTVAQVNRAQTRLIASDCSLDLPMTGATDDSQHVNFRGRTVADTVADSQAQVEDKILHEDFIARSGALLEVAMLALDARRREIIISCVMNGETYEAVGQRMKLSRERIRQLYMLAIKQLRASLPAGFISELGDDFKMSNSGPTKPRRGKHDRE